MLKDPPGGLGQWLDGLLDSLRRYCFELMWGGGCVSLPVAALNSMTPRTARMFLGQPDLNALLVRECGDGDFQGAGAPSPGGRE
jgi:hypothetical protein